jgi:hypothetical protein
LLLIPCKQPNPIFFFFCKNQAPTWCLVALWGINNYIKNK